MINFDNLQTGYASEMIIGNRKINKRPDESNNMSNNMTIKLEKERQKKWIKAKIK